LERIYLHFPKAVVEPASPGDVGASFALSEPLQRGDAAECTLSVDDEPALVLVDGQLDLIAGRVELGDLDAARGDGPEVVFAADGFRAVRRRQRCFDRLRERSDGVARLVLVDDQIAVRQGDE